jgi:hypothetical protein
MINRRARCHIASRVAAAPHVPWRPLEPSLWRTFYLQKEAPMATEPKKQEPDIPPKQPDIQPEPRPEEIPQDKDVPEKETPPMQL